MKAKQLAQVIRKIVREEVQKEVRNVLTEQKIAKQESNSEKLTLSEALQQTETEDYPTMQNFNSGDARAGFASMQQGSFNANNHNAGFQGHNGRVISANKVDPSVSKALTRDYSELVKRFKK